MGKARKAGVYLASANWQHITYLVGIAIAIAHYITPAMAAVIVPALAHHWFQALVNGQETLAQAAVHNLRYQVLAEQGEALLRAEKEERVQCSNPVLNYSMSAPERCANEEGHEGKCEP